MNTNMRKSLFFGILLALLLLCKDTQAQDTYAKVYELIQAKCASCHSGDVPAGQLDFGGSSEDIYQALIGADPTNPAAAEKGYKLVKPGYSRESYLFKKINNGLDPDFMLDGPEGGLMPSYQAALTHSEAELIRQWIAFGAPMTGVVSGTDLIDDYYAAGQGLKTEYLAPPDPSEGFQIYHEPVYLAPGEEKEFTAKVAPNLLEAIEINRVEASIHDYSHHFILYKYFPETIDNVAEGRQVVGNFFDVVDINIGAAPLAIWQFSDDDDLPPGTAYRWEPGTALDLNFHIKNYSETAILAAEVYLNIYTQPMNTAEQEMFANLMVYGDQNPFSLNIPNTGETTLSFPFYNNSSQTAYFWKFQGHTHQLGTDFDMYLRNADGSRGEQIYEGFNDINHEFNQGYWDYEHPPVLRYDALLPVNLNEGLIMEAKWYNDGPSDVGFGITTDDEMFITYYQYTNGPTSYTATEDLVKQPTFDIYPTAYTGQTSIRYQVEEQAQVSLQVFDVHGKLVQELANEKQAAGMYQTSFSAARLGLPASMYIVRLQVDGQSISKKIFER